MTTLLVDGDIVLYSSSVATEFTCNWGGDNWVLSANLQQSKDLATRYLDGLLKQFKPEQIILCLSGHGNFRSTLNPDYKSRRKDTRKPIIYSQLKEWLVDNYDTAQFANLEADDTMGILATSNPGSIIVSSDKDMQCVPGKLYRKEELVEITLEEANRYHMLQTLTGDPTDGYSGCPRIGPVSAAKALQGPPESHWEAVCKAYEKAGLTEDDALLNARMAYILRNENYDNGEIKLWEPPSSK